MRKNKMSYEQLIEHLKNYLLAMKYFDGFHDDKTEESIDKFIKEHLDDSVDNTEALPNVDKILIMIANVSRQEKELSEYTKKIYDLVSYLNDQSNS
jgi:hypothetical protein